MTSKKIYLKDGGWVIGIDPEKDARQHYESDCYMDYFNDNRTKTTTKNRPFNGVLRLTKHEKKQKHASKTSYADC